MKTETQEVKAVDVANAFPTVKKVETAVIEPKTAIERMMEKVVDRTPPTAEERIGRIEHFEALSKRFKLLKEKSSELKMFDAGNDRTNAKIILKNSSDFEFSVSNSNVIKKVRDAMEQELNILLSEAENEVLNFEI
jgi:hypothetical protein